jgi:hypothetical protein
MSDQRRLHDLTALYLAVRGAHCAAGARLDQSRIWSRSKRHWLPIFTAGIEPCSSIL